MKKKVQKRLVLLNKAMGLKIVEQNVEMNRLSHEIMKLSGDVAVTKMQLDRSNKSLTCAESALNYKEIRENDNAEFMAKVLRG